MSFGTYYHVLGQAIRASKSKPLRTGYSFIQLTSQNKNVDVMDRGCGGNEWRLKVGFGCCFEG